MERLTWRGGVDGHEDVGLNDGVSVGDAICQLAAYEDTGLEPEEIKVILERYRALRSAISDETGQPMVSWTRAGEICRAGKDGRLVVLPRNKARWIKAILDERERQDQKWGYPQKNTFCEWASILAEEVGELSQELNELNFGRGDFGLMEAEAVQVAAVALSILEQSAAAYGVTMQSAVAIGRLTCEEAEAALKKREAEDNEAD
mgnify:CR=1 FL=1